MGVMGFPLAVAGPSIELWEASLRLLLAMVLAAAVGIERELRDQEAGLRTHILVGVGASLFVVVGNFSWAELRFSNQTGVVLDPSRVVAYVITGIGFLGAGAIIKHGTNVRGLTTAASLWVVAAIGVASGSGDYAIAAVATGAVLLSLWPIRWIATAAGLRRSGTTRVDVTLEPGASTAGAIDAVERAGIRVEATRVAEAPDARRLELVVSGSKGDIPAALDDILGTAGVREVSSRG
jgi:putative Mg2+ transporter-C (MgtC) family protein